MCGIAGILAPAHRDLIEKVTRTMTYRGPDEEGYFHDDTLSLGQRRLSINDLEGGRQPISNEDDTLQLVCNGEIYNSPELRSQLESKGHTFKTTSDVEVILHLYEEVGRDCVKQLRGMFAFALWDTKKHQLLVARDHLGQKPLFYYHDGNRFAFASEVKAILQSGLVQPKIDLNGMWHYISLRYIPDAYTLFEDVQKLPAASSLLLDQNGKISIERYWDLNFRDKLPNNEEDVADGLDALLKDTVKLHLLSDVPVGTFLSGGIDSSLITAMMSEASGERFPTFSIGVKEQKFNELPYARMVSEKFNLDAHEKIVQADLIHMIPNMIHHMDEPSDPFGVGVYLVSQIASKHVKVVMGGDGGDESFAGYDRFAGNQLADTYSILPHWFRKTVMKKMTELIPESFGYKSLAQKAKWMNEMSFYTSGERYARSMSFLRFTQDAKEELFTSDARSKIDDYDSVSKILRYFEADNAEHLVDRMLHTDLMTRIPDHLLMIADRMSMAHSLEGRSPLVDYRVVEYAASIPADLKLKGKNLKYILRKVSARYLPHELVYREKQGFGFPIAIWLRTDLKNFLENLFKQSRFIELGIFEADSVNKLLDEHISGKADHNFRLWILLNLEIWYRLYFEGGTVDSMTEFIDSIM